MLEYFQSLIKPCADFNKPDEEITMIDGQDLDNVIRKKRASIELMESTFKRKKKRKPKTQSTREKKKAENPMEEINQGSDFSDDDEYYNHKIDYYLENGERIKYNMPEFEKLPKIVKETAKVVIKDNFDELDGLYEGDSPE